MKKGEKDELWNSVNGHVAGVLMDYVDGPRDDVTGDHSRSRLLTTSSGRPTVSTIRDTMSGLTRPCWRGAECPHDHGPEHCDATYYAKANKCPPSRILHDVRSGQMMAYRREVTPRRVVGNRLDASIVSYWNKC